MKTSQLLVLFAVACATAHASLFHHDPVVHYSAADMRCTAPYDFAVGDTASMRPKIDTGDIVTIQPPETHPFGKQLLGQVVLRYVAWVTNSHQREKCPGLIKATGGCLMHEVVAITPRGLVTAGINNGIIGAGVCEDPGFMTADDYCGFVVVKTKNPNPPASRVNLWQKS